MTTVLLVDDHAILLDSLKLVLSNEPDIKAIGEARTGNEAIKLVQSQNWDVVVLDLSLPDLSGIEVLQFTHQLPSPPPVLILTMHDKKQYGPRLLRLGAAGFISKRADSQELLAALRSVVQGRRYIPPAIADYLVQKPSATADRPRHAVLSTRELQVLCLLAEGQSVAEIAKRLNLSRPTISSHRSHILSKMEMTSTADLVQYAIWHRLIPWSPDAQLR